MEIEFEVVVAVLLTAFVWYAIAKKWRDIQVSKKKLRENVDDGEIQGSLSDLAKAEKELAVDHVELRKRILADHVLADRLSTLHGVSETYMTDLQAFLRERGVSCIYLFQETLPTGEIGIMGRTGIYEFYVDRERAADAKRLIAEFRK